MTDLSLDKHDSYFTINNKGKGLNERSRVVSTPVSYSGGFGFESQPRDRIS
jgi:hypothetical protein